MKKIFAMDYGLARCGFAITDDLGMMAFPLVTVPTYEAEQKIEELIEQGFEVLVCGLPTDLKGVACEIENNISAFIKKLNTKFPFLVIERQDERFTSSTANYYIQNGNVPKMKRRDKGLVDKIAATLILENYLATIR